VTDRYGRLREIIETWQSKRAELLAAQPEIDAGNTEWVREFGTVHNSMTRQLVRELDEQSPEFWTALRELSGNAHRVMRGDTVWEQVKFWIRDWRDSFGHPGASDTWADELAQIRGTITEEEVRKTAAKQRRKFWRDEPRDRSIQA
jgi:hypothetical protein